MRSLTPFGTRTTAAAAAVVFFFRECVEDTAGRHVEAAGSEARARTGSVCYGTGSVRSGSREAAAKGRPDAAVPVRAGTSIGAAPETLLDMRVS